MAFWDKWTSKKVEDPEKQVKKLKKYYMQVMGMDKEAAEEKARQWVNTVGKKSRELEK